MASRWSNEEDRELRRLYRLGVPIGAIAERVGRSQNAVSERRRTLSIAPRPRSAPWSAGEDELLRRSAALGLPASAIAARLGRPTEQVGRRRRVLLGGGHAPRAYASVEDDAIRSCWARGGDVQKLALALGRSAGSVRLRAQKLGVHQPRSRQRWRIQDDAAIRDGYDRGLTCAQIAAELVKRTPSAVAERAAKLGLATHARAWTPREDRDLRQLSRDGVALERAAQLLARTPQALRARARKLNIEPLRSPRAGRPGRPWTAGEDELLRLHHALNPAALADVLDRSPEAVTQRLLRLGLRRGAERSPHHPVYSRGKPTPGQRSTVAREIRTGRPGRHVALARRLDVAPAEIRRMTSDPATTKSRRPQIVDDDVTSGDAAAHFVQPARHRASEVDTPDR